MGFSRLSIPRRATALLALLAMLAFLGSSAGFAADPDADGERCVGCHGCENGDCREDGDPFTSHHHCCATSCMSHAPFALPSPVSSPAQVMTETILNSATVAENGRSPETPYRPPRS